jgi:ABC-type transport system involved in cytochrome bd biosynthesis fused ATPase/permease subunit
MKEIIEQVKSDKRSGISRFLQANPYYGFDFYDFEVMKNDEELFGENLYYESDDSRKIKNEIDKIMKIPNGKNTFFLVGYQGCGKTTFIHSVINDYKKTSSINVREIVLDCDRNGQDAHQIKNTLCIKLKRTITD